MRRLSLAILLGLWPLALAAQEPSTSTPDRFAKALKKLASDDYQEREAGSAEIAALPIDALALVEGELKKPDLELEVRTRLEHVIPLLKAKARKGVSDRKRETSLEWTRKTVLGAYDDIGRKDPKWDGRVREALSIVVRAWEVTVPTPEAKRAYDLTGEAIRAGCDDPLVLYAHARMYQSNSEKNPEEETRLHVDAAKAMRDRGARYHEIRQSFCFARAAEMIGRPKKKLSDEERQQVGDWLDLALSRLAEGAPDPQVPEKILRDIADSMTATGMTLTRDRKVWFEKVYEALTQARPQSTMPLVLKGRVYTDYAWDARGGGWANTVTPEGWKRMAERLDEAEKALTTAWKKNPEDPEAPTLMLVVELGQGKGRPVMETWYRRAMLADPDHLEACQKKMYYLEPKWHGSAEAMLAFGRELLAGGNWDARLPYQLVEAHMTLAGYEEKEAEYYQNDAVWEDFKSVYDRALKRDPDAVWDRTYFAKLACRCGRWSEAKALFDTLGDKADVRAFESREELDRLRAEAAAKGK